MSFISRATVQEAAANPLRRSWRQTLRRPLSLRLPLKPRRITRRSASSRRARPNRRARSVRPDTFRPPLRAISSGAWFRIWTAERTCVANRTSGSSERPRSSAAPMAISKVLDGANLLSRRSRDRHGDQSPCAASPAGSVASDRFGRQRTFLSPVRAQIEISFCPCTQKAWHSAPENNSSSPLNLAPSCLSHTIHPARLLDDTLRSASCFPGVSGVDNVSRKGFRKKIENRELTS